jgi:hypothetical protein
MAMKIDHLSDIVIGYRMCSGVLDVDEVMNSLLTFPDDNKYKPLLPQCELLNNEF